MPISWLSTKLPSHSGIARSRSRKRFCVDSRAGPLSVRLLAGYATLDDTCPDLQTLISRAEANMVVPGAEAANGASANPT